MAQKKKYNNTSIIPSSKRDSTMDQFINIHIETLENEGQKLAFWHEFFSNHLEFPFYAIVKQPILKKDDNTGSISYSLSKIQILGMGSLQRCSIYNIVLIGSHNIGIAFSHSLFVDDIVDLQEQKSLNYSILLLYAYWIKHYTKRQNPLPLKISIDKSSILKI